MRAVRDPAVHSRWSVVTFPGQACARQILVARVVVVLDTRAEGEADLRTERDFVRANRPVQARSLRVAEGDEVVVDDVIPP